MNLSTQQEIITMNFTNQGKSNYETKNISVNYLDNNFILFYKWKHLRPRV